MDEITQYIIDEDRQLTEDLSLLAVIPIAITMAASLSLAMILYVLKVYAGSLKENKKLSKKIKDILKDGKDWKVLVTEDNKNYNAFCIVNPVIFITGRLAKDYKKDPRMVEAVMLHEAGHINNKDAIKRLFISIPTMGAIFTAILMTVPREVFYSVAAIAWIVSVILKAVTGKPQEYRADDFAAKYGYGSDLARFFEIIQKQEAKMRAKVPKKSKAIYVALEKLNVLLDEHPPLKKRIEAVLRSKKTYELARRAKSVKELAIQIRKTIFKR